MHILIILEDDSKGHLVCVLVFYIEYKSYIINNKSYTVDMCMYFFLYLHVYSCVRHKLVCVFIDIFLAVFYDGKLFYLQWLTQTFLLSLE